MFSDLIREMEGGGDVLTLICCINCNNKFSISKLSPLKGRIPLVLPCKHSICEICFKNVIKKTQAIECNVCQALHNITFPENNCKHNEDSWVRSLLPINLYLLGMLTLNASQHSVQHGPFASFNPKFKAKVIKQPEIKTSPIQLNSTEVCSQCKGGAEIKCQQCDVFLCNHCFSIIHGSFAPLQKHQKVPIGSVDLIKTLMVCPIHQDKNLEFYCEDCQKYICFSCMFTVTSCSNHKVKSLLERNTAVMGTLKDEREKVDETFRRLNKTLVDISAILESPIPKSSLPKQIETDVILEISKHYARLHATLQIRETELIKSLHEAHEIERHDLANNKTKIFKYLQDIDETMGVVDFALKEENRSKVNYSDLAKKLLEINQYPWYITREEVDGDTADSVVIDKDIFDIVNGHVTVTGGKHSSYKLLSSEDIPDGVEIPPVPQTLVESEYTIAKEMRQQNLTQTILSSGTTNTNSTSSANSVSSEISSSKDAQVVFQQKQPFLPRGQKGKNNVAISSNVLTIDAIKEYQSAPNLYPNPFSVPPPKLPHGQRNAYSNNVKSKKINNSSKGLRILDIGMVELVMVSYINNPHNFYIQRSDCSEKLIEMSLSFQTAASWPKPNVEELYDELMLVFYQTSWCRGKVLKCEEDKYLIYQVDYGNTITATIDKIRILPSQCAQIPWMAVRCKIAKVEPIAEKWTYENSVFMTKVLNRKPVVMQVVGIRNVPQQKEDNACPEMLLEVNLALREDQNEFSVDIGDALVYARQAVLSNKNININKTYFHQMMYGGIQSRPNFYPPIALPLKQSVNVVLTHVDNPGKFYVRKVQNGQEYTKLMQEINSHYDISDHTGIVYVPEVGMTVACNVAMNTDAMLDCNQMEIKDAQGGTWFRGRIFALSGNQMVRVFLVDTGHTVNIKSFAVRRLLPKFLRINTLAIECDLFEVEPVNNRWSEESIQLMRNLAEKELKIWSASKSQKQRFHRIILYDPYDESKPSFNLQLVEKGYAVATGSTINNRMIASLTASVDHLKLSEPKPYKEKGVRRNKTISNEDQIKRTEVKVVSVESPSMVFVSLASQQDTLKKLADDMNDFYKESESLRLSVWNANDKCAMWQPKMGWCRANVSKICPNSIAELFLMDHAISQETSYDNMRVLDDKFSKVRDGTVKCHLNGIVKAAEGEWPKLTCECLKELVEAYDEIYISKGGEFEDKSLPVELWVIATSSGGALEPVSRQWLKLNDKLIDQGLALPAENKKPIFQGLGEGSGVMDEWLLIINENEDVTDDSQICRGADKACKTERKTSRLFSDWQPAAPLTKTSFKAICTYVDYNLDIFLHDVEQNESLELIRSELNHRFKDTQPGQKDLYWTVGQPCIAEFALDNSFYRARIIEVNENRVKVIFVDYGNVEECDVSKVRKAAVLCDVPIQCHRCRLVGIKPDLDHYSQFVIDFLHKTIVDKEALITVMDLSHNDPIPIKLLLGDMDISHMMVSLGFVVDSTNKVKHYSAVENRAVEENNADSESDLIAENSDAEEEIVRLDSDEAETEDWYEQVEIKEKRELAKNCKYKKNNLPKGFLFRCTVEGIIDSTTFCLRLISPDLDNLMLDIQGLALQQPRLNEIYEFKPCIALYEDDKWYRAEVLNLDYIRKVVKVMFVDYGNVGIVEVRNARESCPKWCELAPRAIWGRPNDIFVSNISLDFEVVELLEKTMLNCELDGQIMGPCDRSAGTSFETFSVELYDLETREPAYQKLVAQKLYVCGDNRGNGV